MVDCSNNSSNARCREPKKLERIPIIPTTDNQNAIDIIPPISEVENLFLTPIPPSVETGQFEKLRPTIINKDIKNNIDPSDALKVPKISNIGISENVSKQPNFVEMVTESIIPEKNSRFPKEEGFIFQISSENQQHIPASPVEDFKFQRKPFENPNKNVSVELDVPFLPAFKPGFPNVPNGEFSLDFDVKPFNNPKNQGEPDVPFLPEFKPVIPKVPNGEFSLDFDVKPFNNPKNQEEPISNIRVPLKKNVSPSSEQPMLNNIQTHFGEHNLVPSPISHVEVFQDVTNEFGQTTSVPKPLEIISEEDRRRPKSNSDDLFKLTTVDILKDFSPSPKFPYPNTKGIRLFLAHFLFVFSNIYLLPFSSLQQEQQLQLHTNYTETITKIKHLTET